MKPTYIELEQCLIMSSIVNIILIICLFSPNIVYFIHKQWFNWKKK